MKTAKQRARSKADKLWQEKGMEGYSDDFGATKCELCDEPAICGHHFFRKSSHPNLRYSFENFIPICVFCHAKITFQDPKTLEAIIIKNRGRKWYNNLLKLASQKLKPSSLNLAYYQNAVKNLS